MAYFGIDWNSFVSNSGLTAADFGTKPGVASFNPTDTQASTNSALDVIGSSMQRYQSVASAVNGFNADQVNSMQETYAPGSSQLRTDTTAALDKSLSGLNSSVVADIMRSSAASSVSAGVSGGPLATASAATQVGLQSLKNLDQTIAASTSWMDSIGKNAAQPFNVGSLFITPAQQTQIDAANNAGEQAYQQNVLNVAAAPTPAGAWMENIGTQLVGAVVANDLKNNTNNQGQSSQSNFFRGNPSGTNLAFWNTYGGGGPII